MTAVAKKEKEIIAFSRKTGTGQFHTDDNPKNWDEKRGIVLFEVGDEVAFVDWRKKLQTGKITKLGEIQIDLSTWSFLEFHIYSKVITTKTIDELKYCPIQTKEMSDTILSTISRLMVIGHNLTPGEVETLKGLHTLKVYSNIDEYDGHREYYLFKLYPDIQVLAKEMGYSDASNPDLKMEDIEWAEKKGYQQFASSLFSKACSIPEIKQKVKSFALSL